MCGQVVTPVAELCDLLDNDCDGTADDNNPQGNQSCNTGQSGVCAVGATECQLGALICNSLLSPSPEQCDGLDNNCDGSTDELDPGGGAVCNTGQAGICAAGTTACQNGSIACLPDNSGIAEICDNLDNNCDGSTDEGNPGGGIMCNTGQLGVCAGGNTACIAGAVSCVATTAPSAEICDGLDNNCNGGIDDGDPGGGVACNTGQPGACASGATACVNGAVACQQTVQPGVEICDNLDNNCDGNTDEGNPGGGAYCNTGLLGTCRDGATDCNSGSIVCTQINMPGIETCDGSDQDCDGVIDNGNPGGGMVCATGQLGPCAAGTTGLQRRRDRLHAQRIAVAGSL